jgi:hypothetical protein
VASGCAKALDRLFRALASAPRREILRLAARQKCAVMQFAAQLNMSESAVSKQFAFWLTQRCSLRPAMDDTAGAVSHEVPLNRPANRLRNFARRSR